MVLSQVQTLVNPWIFSVICLLISRGVLEGQTRVKILFKDFCFNSSKEENKLLNASTVRDKRENLLRNPRKLLKPQKR